MDNFQDSIRLFDTTAKVNTFNYEQMRRFPHVYKSVAKHNCATASRGSADDAQSLESVLYLAVGARVMLRRNLNTNYGLVNGALGTIMDIIVSPDDDLPVFVLIDFDNYTGPTIYGGVPIVPVQSNWLSGNIFCTRTNLPFTISFAMTIHKSQGKEFDRAVVDIGSSERNLGLAYVGLSRVRRFQNLILEEIYPLTRYINIRNLDSFKFRELEERRLRSISLN